MKGDIVTETLWIIGLSILIFLIVFVIVPKFWKKIAETAILSSPSVIIRDISGLMTISGAAPHDITIYYKAPSEKYNYNLDINGKILTIEMISSEDITKKIKEKVNDEIPVDPQVSITESRIFTIQKTRENEKNLYEVYP